MLPLPLGEGFHDTRQVESQIPEERRYGIWRSFSAVIE